MVVCTIGELFPGLFPGEVDHSVRYCSVVYSFLQIYPSSTFSLVEAKGSDFLLSGVLIGGKDIR